MSTKKLSIIVSFSLVVSLCKTQNQEWCQAGSCQVSAAQNNTFTNKKGRDLLSDLSSQNSRESIVNEAIRELMQSYQKALTMRDSLPPPKTSQPGQSWLDELQRQADTLTLPQLRNFVSTEEFDSLMERTYPQFFQAVLSAQRKQHVDCRPEVDVEGLLEQDQEEPVQVGKDGGDQKNQGKNQRRVKKDVDRNFLIYLMGISSFVIVQKTFSTVNDVGVYNNANLKEVYAVRVQNVASLSVSLLLAAFAAVLLAKGDEQDMQAIVYAFSALLIVDSFTNFLEIKNLYVDGVKLLQGRGGVDFSVDSEGKLKWNRGGLSYVQGLSQLRSLMQTLPTKLKGLLHKTMPTLVSAPMDNKTQVPSAQQLYNTYYETIQRLVLEDRGSEILKIGKDSEVTLSVLAGQKKTSEAQLKSTPWTNFPERRRIRGQLAAISEKYRLAQSVYVGKVLESKGGKNALQTLVTDLKANNYKIPSRLVEVVGEGGQIDEGKFQGLYQFDAAKEKVYIPEAFEQPTKGHRLNTTRGAVGLFLLGAGTVLLGVTAAGLYSISGSLGLTEKEDAIAKMVRAMKRVFALKYGRRCLS